MKLKKTTLSQRFADALSIVFGFIFVALSLVVTVETILRKTLNMSIQGADELGGYALAVGATISFAVAMAGRNHIRVDVIHDRLPKALQAVLNWVSVMVMASFAVLLAVLAYYVIVDTMTFRSVSQTPWAVPLIYPQSAWLIGLTLFALVCVCLAIRATWLALSGRIDDLVADFQPRSAKEELDEELQNVSERFDHNRPAP
ncbi:MAG: TRAP transporter small permease subunit [Burkholderiaceae bacterium]